MHIYIVKRMHKNIEMKKLVSGIVAICMMFTFTTTSLAVSVDTGNIYTETFQDEGVTKELTITTYNDGLESEYHIIQIVSPGSTVIYDDRNDYVLENNQHVQVFAPEITTFASRPTSIDHGVDIDPSEWGYIRSNWYSKNFTDYIGSISRDTFIAAIIGIYTTAGVTIPALTATAIAAAFINADPQAECIRLRTYTYGKIGQLNHYGHIHQSYTQDYEPVNGSVEVRM